MMVFVVVGVVEGVFVVAATRLLRLRAGRQGGVETAVAVIDATDVGGGFCGVLVCVCAGVVEGVSVGIGVVEIV